MDRRFLGIFAAIVIIFVGIFVYSSSKTKPAPKIGINHSNQGQTHIQRGQNHPAYNSDPPSSGWHYNDSGAPVPWGAYTQEIPDEAFLHNEEHGGVVITYKPNLPKDQIIKLQKLFISPYSDPKFHPNKTIVVPRSKNTRPIEMAAWTYTYSLDSFDQAQLEDFYLQHVDHSPEAGAGPNNIPVLQTK